MHAGRSPDGNILGQGFTVLLDLALFQITVVDKGDRFTFKPLLYELLNKSASEDEVAPSFTELLAPYPVRFVQVG